MDGLAFNARYFDRTFLTEPDWNDWKTALDSMTTRLTNEKIRQATKAFPKEVQALCADQTADILIQRKANLEKMSRKLYLSLSRNVNVTGTDQPDQFKAERLANGKTEVTVWNEDQSILEYHRIFDKAETKEIRLYGLDGDDQFDVSGNYDKGSKIRMIGGKGSDSFQFDSAKGSGHQVFIYNNKGKTTITSYNFV